MEAPDCFHAGCDHDSSPEKLGKEHFIVDDLLDFSNEEDEDDQAIVGVGDETGSSSDSTAGTNSSISNFPCDIDCQGFGDGAALCGDLCEPYEELAELEWLSNFVEESFASDDLEKLHLISGVQPSSSSFSPPRTKAGDDHAGDTNIFLPEAQVPVKARSKRPRATASTWSSRLLVLSPTTSSSCESELLVPINTNASKKPAKKRKETSEGATFAASDGRKCLHCATDKTPQWRTGPMGPKTLCNACGVRYKSGRLVPEYRPAASPTFVVSKHSNSHRKVLELRRQKEMQHQQQQLARLGMLCEAPAAAGADAGDEFLIDRPIGVDFEQLV